MNKEQARKHIEWAERDIGVAKDHLVIAKAQLAKMDETYSIGDRFVKGTRKALLVNVEGIIAFIALDTGGFWGSPTREIGNIHKISQAEIENICPRFTRYWDSQKKLYVNGYSKENH